MRILYFADVPITRAKEIRECNPFHAGLRPVTRIRCERNLENTSDMARLSVKFLGEENCNQPEKHEIKSVSKRRTEGRGDLAKRLKVMSGNLLLNCG